MEIFYEVRKLFSEDSNRELVFGRLSGVFDGEIGKLLWIGAIPKVDIGEPGEPTDAWGSIKAVEHPVDVAQLLRCLVTTSRGFPDAEIHIRADQFPGFPLDGKNEILSGGAFGRFSKALSAYCEQHPARLVPWEFQIDQRIWKALLEKNVDRSENQILTTRLGRALAFSSSTRLKDPFLGFPLEYPGMERKKKELKIPAQLAEKIEAACTILDRTKQELTERGIYAGLL